MLDTYIKYIKEKASGFLQPCPRQDLPFVLLGPELVAAKKRWYSRRATHPESIAKQSQVSSPKPRVAAHKYTCTQWVRSYLWTCASMAARTDQIK